jgi:hypothetical protein
LAVGCATGAGTGEDALDETAGGSGGAGNSGGTMQAGGSGASSSGAAPAAGGGGSGNASAGGDGGSGAGMGGAGASGGSGSASGGSGGSGGSAGAAGSGGAVGCPDPPTGLTGCSACAAFCDAVWPVTWTGVAGATHYIVTYHCTLSAPTYSTPGTTVDLCTNMGMCNDGACAFGAGTVTVEACNASCCSAPVVFPDTPTACGGGLCC